MELKVHCECGQNYQFDAEPVNNQMPFAVACPACNRDGTQQANTLLQQMAVFKPIGVTEPPAPIAPPPVAGPPPVPVGAPKLRINPEPAPATADMPPPLSSAPGRIAPPQPVAPATTLTWYQYLWIGLPLVLIALGGCIGGACGGAACALNRTVFLKTSHPVLKYVWTGMISAAAVVIWLIIVTVLVGALHGLGQHQ
jgi:hypothetical protein